MIHLKVSACANEFLSVLKGISERKFHPIKIVLKMFTLIDKECLLLVSSI